VVSRQRLQCCVLCSTSRQRGQLLLYSWQYCCWQLHPVVPVTGSECQFNLCTGSLSTQDTRNVADSVCAVLKWSASLS
jgi:hypothetical protein